MTGLARPFTRLAFLLALVGCGTREEPLPVLGTAPEFSFRDQEGRPVRRDDLRGAPWVADFVFTRCPSACPMLTAQMQNLQRRLGDDADRVTMVSFSVDPEHDTPEVLRRYAAGYGIEGRWLFLTGEVDAMRRAIEAGFRVRMGDRVEVQGAEGAYDIMHGQHFVLLDGENRIRGYYASDAEGLERLEKDVRRLIAR